MVKQEKRALAANVKVRREVREEKELRQHTAKQGSTIDGSIVGVQHTVQ